jgi:hypothetical protein
VGALSWRIRGLRRAGYESLFGTILYMDVHR